MPQSKTLTAIGSLEQQFHFLRSRDQVVHFDYLALREYLNQGLDWGSVNIF